MKSFCAVAAKILLPEERIAEPVLYLSLSLSEDCVKENDEWEDTSGLTRPCCLCCLNGNTHVNQHR